MSTEHRSIRAELALELQRFGDERGGAVVCLVVMLDQEFEFVWPAELTEADICSLEHFIAEALVGTSRPQALT